MIHRLTIALIAAICAFFWTAGASAQQPAHDCTVTDGEITCPTYRWRLLRDKARAGQLLCEALKVEQLDVSLPARLRAVCTNASVTSRIWAQAETWKAQERAANEAQRRVNVLKGRLSEVRRRAKKVPPLRRKLGATQEKLEAWYRSPWVMLGAVLVAGGGGYVVGAVTR